ncbi:MAG: recombination regulator RecX [Methylococcaceae bacterium]|nr:recombination regulator RecX [Methylococcaceae bacterium]
MAELTERAGIQAEIKEACLRYLMRREHSRHELLQKVAAKGFLKSDIDYVIDALAEHGLQSDVRFAESYARSRIHKGFGPLRIKAELQQRGAGDCYFDMAVEDIAGSWRELLAQIYEKKYGSDDADFDIKEQLKRSRFLQQRGFSTDMIRELLQNVS